MNYLEATLAFGDLTREETLANLADHADVVMPVLRAATAESQAQRAICRVNDGRWSLVARLSGV